MQHAAQRRHHVIHHRPNGRMLANLSKNFSKNLTKNLSKRNMRNLYLSSLTTIRKKPYRSIGIITAAGLSVLSGVFLWLRYKG